MKECFATFWYLHARGKDKTGTRSPFPFTGFFKEGGGLELILMVWPGQGFLVLCAKFRIFPTTFSLDFKPMPSKKWGIRMRVDQLSLQPKCHAKAQRAPTEIFRFYPFLNIFLTPLYTIDKTITGSLVESFLGSCGLVGEKLWRRLEQFDLGIKTHGWRPEYKE